MSDPRLHRRDRDRGFTLVEMLIALVLSGIIAGVTVAAMVTSMNAVSSTTEQVADSTDASLISAYLFRDAQAAGGTDPSTAEPDAAAGVATAASAAADVATTVTDPAGGVPTVDPWAGCAQTGDLVVRFSWFERSAGVPGSSVVATYALGDDHELTRRVCEAGAITDVVLGTSIGTASASCAPDPSCGPVTDAVSLTVTGTGTRSPLEYTLTASLRADQQPQATLSNSAVVPLLVLGEANPSVPCPSLLLHGTGSVKVLGDAVVSDRCGAAPIGGDQTRLQPTGATTILTDVTDPFASEPATPGACGAGTNPSPFGAASSANDVVVYPQPVTLGGTVAVQPGRYVLCHGLTITDGASVTGTDVFFDVVGGTVTVAPGAQVALRAPASGDRANLLLRVATPQRVRIEQSSRPAVLSGVVDAPTSTVELTGTSPIAIGGLVARNVDISGGGPLRFGLPVPLVAITTLALPDGQRGSALPATSLASTGGTAPYTWSAVGLPDGVTLSPTGDLAGTPTVAGDVTVTITAVDATNAAATVALPLHVREAPSVSGPASLPAGQSGIAYPPVGTTMAATVSGGTAPYTWSATGLPTGVTISASGVIAGTPTVSGTFAVQLSVVDGIGAVATKGYTLAVRDPLLISAPASLASGKIGVAYASTTVTASGGATPYAWSATGFPAGITMDGFGTITGTPTVSGAYAVTVTATDAGGATATANYPLTIAAADTGGNPMTAAQRFQLIVEHDATVGTYGLAGSVAVGGNLRFKNWQVIASGETSTFSAPGADQPAGLVVGGSVDLAGTGTGNQLTVGSGLLHVGSLAGQSLLTFGTNIHLVPSGVTDNWTTPRVIVQADQTNQTIDGVGQPGVLPFGSAFTALRASSSSMAALDPTTCSAIAAPTVTEAYGNYTLTLVSGKVNVWSLSLAQITTMVNLTGPTNPSANTPLVINVIDGGAVAVPSRWWTPLQNGAPSSILWNFPNATSVTVNNGFTGTLFAPNAEVTIQNVQLTGDVVASSLSLLDGNGSVNHFTAVIPCTFGSLAVTSPASLPRGQIGFAYPATSVSAAGGSAPYSWTASGLPAGMSMGATGTISGTPTAAGNGTVTVTVTDTGGATVSRAYPLTIDPAPTVASPSTLPQGEVAVAYPTPSLTASGGTAPYTWTATGLPSGLSISSAGAISGTPTTAGSSTVVVTVHDARGATGTRQYALTVSSSTCNATAGNWAGQYYKNITLSGTPTMCRQDGQIDFDWGSGSPGGGVTTDNFSVRWTRTADFVDGTYDFTKGSDDGWRMYIDGALVLDDWNYQTYANGIEVLSKVMTAGTHTVVVEYFEGTGQAKATLSWALIPPVVCPSAPSGWVGEYFKGRDLAGSPVLCRDDANIDFDWATGSPGTRVPSDDFSVRWTRTSTFAAGDYRFTAGSDDGMRLYVDGALVIDHWSDRSYATNVVTVPIAAGSHTVVMEFYERGGSARATLVTEQLPSAPCPATVSGWLGQYYLGRAFDGGSVVCRDDASINFNWASGSPDPAVPINDFSVRWTRTVTFAAGTHSFVAGSDDGVRVYIDGVLVINAWVDRSYATTSASRTLTAGQHTIVMEFYEHGGSARATLTWT